ncbi:MAG: XisH family protein [Lyngbya sp.]|nr:XisH family protein [Lyngbya sp.]
MAAKDVFHNAVKAGLEKENWMITDDPYKVQVGGVEMYIDLAAERILAAEKEDQKIAVEIKSFINPSAISEFHTAIGQFLNCQVALEEQEPDRILYLAVPQGSYKTFFSLQFVQTVIQRFKIKIIVYDPVDEVIVQWIN